MPHRNPTRPARGDAQVRIRIAQAAARLILDHGISDWFEAKRKAARQLLLPDNLLPDDDEVEAALFEQQALFGAQRKTPHAVTLNVKRQQALRWMDKLGRFKPKLYGGVADGWGGEHQDVRLELQSDDTKAVELTLLNLNCSYQICSGREGEALTLIINDVEGDVYVRIVSPDNHQRKKYALLDRDAVKKLVEE